MLDQTVRNKDLRVIDLNALSESARAEALQQLADVERERKLRYNKIKAISAPTKHVPRPMPDASQVRPDGGDSAMVPSREVVRRAEDREYSDVSDGKPPRRPYGYSGVEVVRKAGS